MEGSWMNAASGLDKRIRTIVQIARAVPATPQGAPEHAAGSLGVGTTMGRNAEKQLVSIPTPSAVALPLVLAIKSSKQAHELRERWRQFERPPSSPSPFGPVTSVDLNEISILYDYFEHCMVVITFSFQAVEAYCNEVIGWYQTDSFTYKRGNTFRELSPREQERQLSTTDKLSLILPSVLDRKNPSGTKIWSDFIELKRWRDSSVHPKSFDAAPKVRQASDLDDPTFFIRLMDAKTISWVRAAVRMIDYFAVETLTGEWLNDAKQDLQIREQKPKGQQGKLPIVPRGKLRKAAAASSGAGIGVARMLDHSNLNQTTSTRRTD